MKDHAIWITLDLATPKRVYGNLFDLLASDEALPRRAPLSTPRVVSGPLMMRPHEELVVALETAPTQRFLNWPVTDVRRGPSGVYTIWRGEEFLYVGMSYAHRHDIANPTAKGMFGRLAQHASGRRSGDQFCVYICDRFVVPTLSPDDMADLAAGARILDQRTRAFIHDQLSYRAIATDSGEEARSLELHVRNQGLPVAGRPLINP